MDLPGSAQSFRGTIEYSPDNDPIDSKVCINIKPVVYYGPDISAFGIDVPGDSYTPALIFLKMQAKIHHSGEIRADLQFKPAEFRFDLP